MTSSKSMRELLREATELEKSIAQRERPARSLMAQKAGPGSDETNRSDEGAESPDPGPGSPATST